MASFDGVAKKGKTKGKYVGKGGTEGIQRGGTGSAGVTSEEMRKVGRNLARANYQKRG